MKYKNKPTVSTTGDFYVMEVDGVARERIENTNHRRVHIAYITCGSASDPCILVPPGGGATKENSLFWARELAAKGKFFIVLYDLRDTGGSQKTNWKQVFEPFGTTAEQELKRLTGRGADIADLTKKRGPPRAMNAELMEQLWDYDAHAHDAIAVLDELKIAKSHVMGLSQGGFLAQVIAMLYPDRVLTCVSAGTVFDSAGSELAMLSTGAEEFYEKVKGANLYDKQGKPPWAPDSVSKEDYVEWKVKMLGILIPGFPTDLFIEIAEKEFDVGLVTPEEGCICALSWELWVRMGKMKRHHHQLRANTVPILYIHGRKDPIIHFGEVERLYKITKNCVLETHDFGHNFGPPKEQKKILAKVIMFMKKYAKKGSKGGIAESQPMTIGSDTYSANVSADVGVVAGSTIPQLYNAFCTVQTAADTHAVFNLLLEKLQLLHLRGGGLRLFMSLKTILGKAGLNFKQTKLIRDLHTTLLNAQKVVGNVKYAGKEMVAKVLQESIELYDEKGQGRFNKVLVCGAGPIGLRTACELQLLNFDVVVVEKRPNFSRANILTFWDETMADMLGLGAKSYFPSLQPSGTNKHLGTRQIQVCLLKTLLLLGGRAHYGMEVCGLCPPSQDSKKRWRACFRPYVKHRRAEESAAELAVEFQKSKDYVAGNKNEQEHNSVEEAFVNSKMDEKEEAASMVEFDAYVIAEGGWSDSTKKLGFNKSVSNFKSIFGLVINAKYSPGDMKEKNMRSSIHFALSGNWPLRRCPIQAEFLEYLKGETHFFALVVSKKNDTEDRTEQYLEKMEKEKGTGGEIPQSVIDMMRLASKQKGLLEMGVLKEDRGTGRQCLAADNVDVAQLHAMARVIMSEMGLPDEVHFCESNPVQLFDFSRRARCLDPVRLLCASSSPSVLSPADFSEAMVKNTHLEPTNTGIAMALPVGDALQEPNWTQGLGINRGFHTAMNQAFVCLLAREKSLLAAVAESCAVHKRMLDMKWGMGHSGLAGSGSGKIGLKPFKKWDTDPRNRIPYK
mmetsp:Transcript_28351/g.34584  ORF Transcript_28351/g.34584 Transcript_28351/m.34584 type:complete len:1012 (+) Transcript_28351:531-3566(+)